MKEVDISWLKLKKLCEDNLIRGLFVSPCDTTTMAVLENEFESP